MTIAIKQFTDVALSDPFFDSLKTDYAEFSDWFNRKASEPAYVSRNESDAIDGFLYVKVESGAVADVSPQLPASRRLKVGTMKIVPHGTRLGERFIKKIFDHAVADNVEEVYVTVFPKHEALIGLFRRYGFEKVATKTTANGTELVLARRLRSAGSSTLERYPIVKLGDGSAYLLSLYPKWHTRLLPDSILKNESAAVVQDVSHSNSIHKVYLAAMRGMEVLRPGDVLLIYRTGDDAGPAHFRAVATSICVVEEYRSLDDFESKTAFVDFCLPYSVFTKAELEDFWRSRKYPHVIRFTYNLALPKRITRGKMIEEFGFDSSAYWGFLRISPDQLKAVAAAGALDEDLVID
ncbi:MAG: N-acetyltransferase [Gemmatimonadaceae bacterium]|nr:N-acetyltransferase [Gemmatimonadaceae bacterium]